MSFINKKFYNYNNNIVVFLLVVMTQIFCCGIFHGPGARGAGVDELVIGRVSIADVVVEGVSEGRVTYLLGNRSSTRAAEVVVIYFDNIPALRAGEVAFAAGDYAEAVKFMRTALVAEAEFNWQRAWILYRLALVYDGMGEYTNAVGVWAELIVESPETYWIIALPVCEPDYADDETVDKVLKLLGEADRVVSNSMLKPSITEMIKQVEWIRDREPRAPDPQNDAFDDKDGDDGGVGDDEDDLGSQLDNNQAGISEEKEEESGDKVFKAGDPEVNNNESNNNYNNNYRKEDLRVNNKNNKTVRGQTGLLMSLNLPVVLVGGSVAGGGGERAGRIDKLLNAGNFELAKRELEKLVAEPGFYPLDRLLYQYGLVLLGTGNVQEALVRFLQCGILFESSEFAGASFCEAGGIYLLYYGELHDAGKLDMEKVTEILLKAKGLAEDGGSGQDLVVDKVEGFLLIEAGESGGN